LPTPLRMAGGISPERSALQPEPSPLRVLRAGGASDLASGRSRARRRSCQRALDSALALEKTRFDRLVKVEQSAGRCRPELAVPASPEREILQSHILGCDARHQLLPGPKVGLVVDQMRYTL